MILSFAHRAMAFVTCGLLAMPACASVVYSYVGADFNLRNSSKQLSPVEPDPAFTYSATDGVSFSLTLDSALASGTTTDLQGETISWTASDGKHSLAGTNPVNVQLGLITATFTTDAAGAITAWSFRVNNLAYAGDIYSSSNPFGVGEGLGFASVRDYAYSRPDNSGAGNIPIRWGGAQTAGSWTITDSGTLPVPEPGTLGLAMLGGVLVMQARRVRRTTR